MTGSITVLNYTRDSPATTSASLHLLTAARALTIDSGQTQVWRSVEVQPAFDETFESRYAYMLHAPHLVLPDVESAAKTEIKEWGLAPTPVDEPIVVLDMLEEFESTNLACIARPAEMASSLEKSQAPTTSTSKRPISVAEQPSKRVKLDHSVLKNAIPFPHFYPPLTVKANRPDHHLVPPYSKSSPIAIAPYTMEHVSSFLEQPHARSAWVVPIRGDSPWPSCTSASVQHSSCSYPPQGVKDRSNSILWTESAVQQFWAALLDLRNAGSFACISLSFHMSTAALRAEAISSISSAAIAGHQPDFAELTTPQGSTGEKFVGDAVRDQHKVALRDLDYIKVYHDAKDAMRLRTVLDALHYEMGNNETEGLLESKSRKIRLLHGARLALVDHLSNGLLAL